MPVIEETTRECPEAWQSLRYSLIGILCLILPIAGVVMGILAITKGATARSMIAQNPQLTGHGAATAGIIIGCMITVVTGLAMLASASH